jgi:1-acyl-sn-glycerol-3-phosphate acyltransferase
MMDLVHPDRLHRIGHVMLLLLARIMMFLLSRWQAKGRENVPREGPLLIVSNHLGHSDQQLLAVSINRKIIFMAKEELFSPPPLRFLVQSFGAFPVRRGGMDRGALKEAHRVLDSGLALGMFPEGTRSKDAKLQPPFPGSALIALHKDVPILPVGITGMESAQKGIPWVIRHRPRVAINIGRPFYLPATDDKLTKERLVELADYIMEHIAELLPPEYRGHYAKK